MAYYVPSEIADLFVSSARLKNNLGSSRLFLYALLGGAFIALGGLLALMIAGGMPSFTYGNPGLFRFLLGAVFPLGLFLVVIGGAELFTSDCAVLSFGVFRRQITISCLLRLWGIVYIGNLIGALFVAYFLAYETGIFRADPWLTTSVQLGEAKTSAPFFTVFLKGIGANWLVCMAVWMAFASSDISGKMLAIWFPVMAFVALGFEHSIANMFFIPLAMLQGADINLYGFLIGNLLPATLGNIVGGAALVAGAYSLMFPEIPKPAMKMKSISGKPDKNKLNKTKQAINNLP